MLSHTSRVLLVAITGLLAINAEAAQEMETETEKHTRVPNSIQVPIPQECLLKARALVASASLSSTDLNASKALVYLLAQTDTRMNVSYTLQPQIIQKNSITGLSEIKLQGTFDSMVMSLVGAAGSAYANTKTKAYKTLTDAQSASTFAGAGVKSSLVQINSNQANLSLDLIAKKIQTFNADFNLRSTYRSQAYLEFLIATGGSVTSADDTSSTFALAKTLTLADLITSIDIDATVRYDGTNLLVSHVNTDIGC